jgi:hypothetical protein
MVSLTALWLPILLSGLAVFFASSVIHMLLPYHRSDYGRVPSEDAAMDAIRKLGIAPGDYFLPCASNPAEMHTPEFKQKLKQGPLVFMTVLPQDGYAMGPRLMQWLIYTLLVSAFTGLVVAHGAGPEPGHRRIFHLAILVAFSAYALGLWQNSIWYSRKWSTTLKSTLDGLIYAALTAEIFSLLWPRS